MKTTKWAYTVLFFYVIVNILLIILLSKFVLFDKNVAPVSDILPFAAIVAGVLLVCQFFMLRLKVDVIEKRPVSKRKITSFSIVVGFLLAAISFTIFVILFFLFYGEGQEISISPWLIVISIFGGSWVFWFLMFFNYYVKSNTPSQLMYRATQALVVGSVLELLVAIPSHIIMRSRGDCCAPIVSYFGIVTGTAILLCAFGPGLVFLFAKRMMHKSRKTK